jgi:hypothetical protein
LERGLGWFGTDAGRGFAVAAEVKNFASQAKQATDKLEQEIGRPVCHFWRRRDAGDHPKGHSGGRRPDLLRHLVTPFRVVGIMSV